MFDTSEVKVKEFFLIRQEQIPIRNALALYFRVAMVKTFCTFFHNSKRILAEICTKPCFLAGRVDVISVGLRNFV